MTPAAVVDAHHQGVAIDHRHHLCRHWAGDDLAKADDLRGGDRLSGPSRHKFVVRFHLHPEAQMSLIRGGDLALLRPVSAKCWRFRASGGALAIEERVYFGSSPRKRRRQVTISDDHTNCDTVVK